MLERHPDAFFPGALVFPGGRVDDEDRAAGDTADMPFRRAAIRETWEEAGILFARRPGAPALLSAAERDALALPFAALVAAGAIVPATDALVPFAHWVTPERSPKRYDTLFFLALAPADQVPRPDGHEAVDIVWIAPAAALADADAKRRHLIFATRMNLMRLARSGDAAAALADAAASAHRIARICPEMYDTPAGTRIRIPEGLGYDVCDMPTANSRHG
jgi:8-oxo-dGTP pyrophosphatase MutT (NUDIX family)